MRAVIQRVLRASVLLIDKESAGEGSKIEKGMLILLGVSKQDTLQDASYLAEKIANLRIFEDENGKLNHSIKEQAGSVLLISNFTLYGDCRKGRRPSFSSAADGASAEPLYQAFGAILVESGIPVQYGVFGADMQISLINDGPVTMILDSDRSF